MQKVNTLTPKIKWAQRSDKLYLTVEIRDIKNEKIDLLPASLSFRGESDDKIYEFKIEFFAEVSVEQSKWNKLGFHLQFIIFKSNTHEKYWPRLLKDTKKYQHIVFDWDKYVDQDDQKEEANKGVSGQEWDPNAMQGFPGQQAPQFGGEQQEQEGGVEDLEENQEIPKEAKHEHVHGQNCNHGH